jgi:hypothetical protein
MSSRKVVIDGVTFIRSRDAARAVNLALDYVSRLARHGAIAGVRVAGIWFVNLPPLKNFIADQERQTSYQYASCTTQTPLTCPTPPSGCYWSDATCDHLQCTAPSVTGSCIYKGQT